ncbi:MAG: IclR family transcriptional regulator [Actinobacteria bacterium]|nr:IclR family transcriptional regulator [Actinomycetota bacterium]
MSRDELGPDFVQSLARGLEVIQAFSRDRPSQTLSEVAEHTALSRATARRLLLTLEHLGFVESCERRFQLTPRVLDLGYTYLSSLGIGDVAHPHMERLAEQLHESTSASVLDGHEIVYVVRIPTHRIMTISLDLGTRLPAFCTSMGRVLLASLPPDQLDGHLEAMDLHPHTKRTVTDVGQLRAILDETRERGWALVDQELEDGVRSVATPLRDGGGRVVAALNVSGHAGRVTLGHMRDRFLPPLLETARTINQELARRWTGSR